MWTPRLYQGDDDLRAIITLARACHQHAPHSTFHPGDLTWWAYYNPWDRTEDTVALWHDAQGDLLGCAFLVPFHAEADLLIHPQADPALYGAMLDWAEAFMRARLRSDPALGDHISHLATPLFGAPPPLEGVLHGRGYQAEEHLILFEQALPAAPPPVLPPGYHFLETMHPRLAEQRAEVHCQAFAPSRMSADYYRHLMQAPGYDPSLDVVVVAPDGTFASFALCWADEALRVGEFEPVGTHPDHRRLGLGHAALLEGLRRLHARGMQRATLCCDATHAGNIAFYQGAGFHEVNRVRMWMRAL